MGFLVALRLLTTIPAGKGEIKPKDQGSSLAYFPLIGLILGLILVISDIVLSFLLPSSVVNATLIIVLIFMTGALHLDGFIDTCDGAFTAKTPEERLKIMSDTRVGAFGVVGVIALLLLKYAALSNLAGMLGALRWPALLLMPVVARWAIVYAVYSFPYAKKEGMGLAFKRNARWPGFLVATLLMVVIVVAVDIVGVATGLLERTLLELFIFTAATWLVASVVGFFLRRRLGGLTGDNYGAIAEISEVAFIMFIFAYFNIRLLIG